MSTRPSPPPKPLYLTTRKATATATHYPGLPEQWTQSIPVNDSHRPTKQAYQDDDDEQDQFITAKSTLSQSSAIHASLLPDLRLESELDLPYHTQLHPQPTRTPPSDDGQSTGTLTLRRPKSAAGAFNSIGRSTSRASIYFDPAQMNPFVVPVETADPTLNAARDSSSESHPPSTPPSSATSLHADSPSADKVLELPAPLPAISLHPFVGETNFGELSFPGNVDLVIEVEDIGGGWSLGYELVKGEEGRGLIPRGFYALIVFQDEEPAKPDSDTTISTTPPPSTSASLASDPISTTSSSSPTSPIQSQSPTLPTTPILSPTLNAPDFSPDRLERPISSPSSSPEFPLRVILSPSSCKHTSTISEETEEESEEKEIDEEEGKEKDEEEEDLMSGGGRSIGRNVVVSGILFEPTDSIFLEKAPFQSKSGWANETAMPIWDGEDKEEASTEEEEGDKREDPMDQTGVTAPEDSPSDEIEVAVVIPETEDLHASSLEQSQELRRDSSSDTIRPSSHVSTLSPHPPDLTHPSDLEYPLDEPTSNFDISAVNDLIAPSAFCLEEMRTLTPVLEEEDGADLGSQKGSSEKMEIGEINVREGQQEGDMIEQASNISVADHPIRFDQPLATSDSSTSRIPPPPPQIGQTTSASLLARIGLGTLSTSSFSVGSVGIGTGGVPKSLMRIKSTSRDIDPKGKGRIIQEWILNGEMSAEDVDSGTGYYIDSGPTWRQDDIPPFTIQIHSPSKRSSTTGVDYTVFQLSTSFSAPHHHPSPSPSPSPSSSSITPSTITVERRYSHFTSLYALLVDRYPIIVIPQLPAKSYAGRFQEQFVETRRRDLERWLSRIARSPVLRASEEVRGFLIVSEDVDLKKLLSPSSSSTTGKSHAAFLNQVFHPEYNVDTSEAKEVMEKFEKYAKASENGKGVLEVEIQVGKVRENLRHVASSFRQLAHSMVRVVAAMALPTVSTEETMGMDEDDQRTANEEGSFERIRRRARALCVQNEEGAYTWKESDEEALSVSKAMQATAEAISVVGDLYDRTARTKMFSAEETLRELAYPYSQSGPLLELHKLTLALHEELNEHSNLGGEVDFETEEAIARADTVLNISSAEIERVHTERLEDLKKFSQNWLQDEIEFHEQATAHLRFALSHFEPSAFASLSQTGPRLRSALERPPPTSRPLPVPSNYGIPTHSQSIVNSALLIRPVGVVGEVITERVGPTLMGLRGVTVVGGAGKMRSPSTTDETRVNADVVGGGSLVNGRSAAEALQRQGAGGPGGTAEIAPKPSWRNSLFGTGRLW